MHDGTSDRYAETIVNLLESFAQSPRLPVIAGIVESKTQIKRRLAMITGYKPPRRIEKVIAPALLAILAMAILTDAQDSAVPAQQQMLKQSGAVSFTPAYVFADKFRVSASEQASRLVYQTEPVYPENAKAVGIVGETEFEVTVDEGGNVIDIWSVKGHPLLANAAADAIQRWRYSSILLDNTPTSVSFPIIIAFLPDGTVTTSLVMTTQPLQNGFLNTPIPPAVIDDESPNSRILTAANTGFRTFKGRRYLLIGQGMSAAVVDIDKNKLRDLADVGWPVEYEPTDSGIAPMVFRVFINKAGGIDGIEQEYGPRIPAIDDLLLHTRVLSPAMFGTETVPSHLRFEISPPQSLIDKETQFVSPAFIRRPASPTDLRQR
jgi:TonB family protein